MAVYSIFSQATAQLTNSTLQGDQSAWNFGMEFEVSTTLAITGVWWGSKSGAGTLPTDTGIWLIGGSGTIVAHHASPSWSGAAGSGWVKDTYPGSDLVTTGNKYIVAIRGVGSTSGWYTEDNAGSSAWASGRSNGPLSAPSSATGVFGQDPFLAGAWAYPNSNPSNGFGFNVDIELSDIAAGGPPSLLKVSIV